MFTASAGVGIGIEVLTVFKAEVVGTYRTYVDEGYTDYGVNRWGRTIASLRMAKDLLIPEPYIGIRTGGSAPVAAIVNWPVVFE